MTNEQAVYDIINRLGQTSDDADISYRLAAAWLDEARQKLIQEYLEKRGEDIPRSMLKRLTCVPIDTEETDCDDCPDQIIELDYNVYDLPDDIGVYQVLRPGGEIVDRLGSAGEASLNKKALFGSDIEGWHRAGKRLYLTGNFPDDIKFTIYIIPSDINELDEEDNFPAPGELLLDIAEEAEKIGNRKLGRPHDITSDGKSLSST